MNPDTRGAGRLGPAVRPVDRVAVERTRRRLEAASQAPWLHGEVARRMAERLPLLRQGPARVLDWWPDAGGSREALLAALPEAGIDSLRRPEARAPTVGADVERRSPAAPWWSWKRWQAASTSRVRDVVEAEAGHYPMVWANMLLHHVDDPLATMAQWHQALAVDGCLMFSTLGPGTLQALRDLYRDAAWGSPMAGLVDMHDLGDQLVEAGFADPVMDQEIIRLTWRNVVDAVAELRSLGANVDAARLRGLRTPRWRQRLFDRLARVATQPGTGRIELEFEVVYGHAFKPPARLAIAPEARIGVDELRQTLRRSRS